MFRYNDPVDHFAYTRWHKINARTVNGANPDTKSRGSAHYVNLGIKIKFTRTEFNEWCERNRDVILKLIKEGHTPSVDRINSEGHYALDNMRIISLKENIAAGVAKRNRLRSEKLANQYPPKPCAYCGKLMYRNPRKGRGIEPYAEFDERKSCGRRCASMLRERNSEGDFV